MSVRVAAVDVGGSGVRATAYPSGPGCAAAATELDRALPVEVVLSRISGALAAVLGDDAAAVVVAIPSFVWPDGTIADCPSIPALEGLDLAAALAATARGAPVTVIPDLAAAVVGEHRHGSGRGIDRFVCVSLGTGANAAAIVEGRFVETAFGCLGDAGQVVVEPDGPACPCGGRGCLEAVCSGFALARDGAPLGLADGRAVIEAGHAGRPEAVAILDRAGRGLGRAIASWSAMLWPHRVAVAGGLAAAGELLLEPARRELQRVGAPYIVRDVEVVTAQLGQEATLIGAGELALDLVRAK